MKELIGKAKDLTGKEFKHFKVVSLDRRYRDKTTRVYWKCICKACGKTHSLIGHNIVSGHSKSCGCMKTRTGNTNPNWQGCGSLGQDKYREIIYGASTRGIPFFLSIEELWSLFLSQDGKCALTHLPLSLKRNRHKSLREDASLDRIDSSLPYKLGNVRWLHKDVNLMKNILSDERLFELSSLIVKNFLTKHQKQDKVLT